MPRPKAAMATVPPANPSKPSVRFTAFEVAVTINTTKGMKNNFN